MGLGSLFERLHELGGYYHGEEVEGEGYEEVDEAALGLEQDDQKDGNHDAQALEQSEDGKVDHFFGFVEVLRDQQVYAIGD